MRAFRSLLILTVLAALTGLPAAARPASAGAALSPAREPAEYPAAFPPGDALFIGVPFEDVFGLPDAGAVVSLYAQPGGLSSAGSQLWTEEMDGAPGAAGPNHSYGTALASGDFNADGYPDLAIGIPGESTPDIQAYGAVTVLYGQASGLIGSGGQFWRQGENGLADTYESPDQFGASLAAGDFNADGYSDLAIGVPYEGFTEASQAGAVHILYGSPAGLTGSGSLFIQDWGGPHPETLFGSTLAALDYNCDHYVDLAVGAPAKNYVNVYQSSPGGMAISVGFGMMVAGRLGHSLAVGDFNGDTCGDLAMGAPNMSVDEVANAGKVRLAMNLDADITEWVDQVWNQNQLGAGSTAEADDHFGSALAAADFNGDGRADLAVGSRGEDNYVGAVSVLYNSGSSLSAAGSQAWTLDSPGIPGERYWDDYFGDALAAGYFNADAYADLAVSADGSFFNGLAHAGAVSVIYGSGLGLDASLAAAAQTWTQNNAGIIDDPEENDYFGQAIASSYCPVCRQWPQSLYLPLLLDP